MADLDRREGVLDSAITTFARFGYRKTSMDEIARAARISRPGLYLQFSSKEDLFRAAVARSLELDLAAVRRVLDRRESSVVDRIVGAFDDWAGRYVGPLAADVSGVIAENPEILGDVARDAPARFTRLIEEALADLADPVAVTQTLISVSIGLKHQVESRAEYLSRFRIAVGLLLAPKTSTPGGAD